MPKECNFSVNKYQRQADDRDWLRFIRNRSWSRRQKLALLDHFSCPSKIFETSSKQLQSLVGEPKEPQSLFANDDQIKLDLQWLKHDMHYLIHLNDPRYPPLLRELSDPPLALFAAGDINLLLRPQVAVVGSRRPTPIGSELARRICEDLAQLGVIITSGMALGIDAVGHQAALNVNEATIAVLATGLDIVYPVHNKGLFERIVSNGVVVSEYPLGTSPRRYSFPERNRIVSGLSYGVVIVEAAERSGTLITAKHALEQNRELMVVPGSALSSQYKGSHKLIQQGAALVFTAADVVNCLYEAFSDFLKEQAINKLPTKQSDDAKALSSFPILAHISTESTSIDEIIAKSRLTAAEVASMLVELELLGFIAVMSDGGYVNLT